MGLCVHPMIPVQSCDEPVGFPIRTSPDITPAHGSPRLFAVFHVLLRRLTPRHPPYALSSFALPDTESFTFHFIAGTAQDPRAAPTLPSRFCSSLRYAVGKELGRVGGFRPPSSARLGRRHVGRTRVR